MNGFSKSLDISKDFDRQEGHKREVVGWMKASPKGYKRLRTGGASGSFGRYERHTDYETLWG